MKVAILGASSKPFRYAHLALKMLQEHGHEVFPVNPSRDTIDGTPCYGSLKDIPKQIDTVTLYVSPEHLRGCLADLLAINPARVIFNPGSESPDIERVLIDADIHTERACTLVLLRTGQFDLSKPNG